MKEEPLLTIEQIDRLNFWFLFLPTSNPIRLALRQARALSEANRWAKLEEIKRWLYGMNYSDQIVSELAPTICDLYNGAFARGLMNGRRTAYREMAEDMVKSAEH